MVLRGAKCVLRFNTASGMAQLQREFENRVYKFGGGKAKGFNTASGMAQLQRRKKL